MVLMIFIVILIAAIVAAKFLRAKRRKDTGTNYYRSYRAKPPGSPRMRANRYHRQNQCEPTLGYKHTTDIEEFEEERTVHSPAQKMEPPPPTPSDDPDVVLGLKEEKTTISQEPALSQAVQMTLRPPSMLPPIVTFHVMALSDCPYTGYELLQAILSVGMRYGKHQIFHRHQEKTGRGKILFSLASVVRPGFFDLPKMGGFSTMGLSLFFRADEIDDPLAVYELMLQTAGQLVEDLGGHVLDENRDLLTPATVVEQRRQLREYTESQYVPDLFEVTES